MFKKTTILFLFAISAMHAQSFNYHFKITARSGDEICNVEACGIASKGETFTIWDIGDCKVTACITKVSETGSLITFSIYK
jgi:hypothetical protein